MDRERPRWRMRIRTVMLLVAITALAATLVVEPRRRLAAEAHKMRAENEARLAAAEAYAAQVAAEHARAQVEQAEAQRRKALDDAKGSGRRSEVKAKGE
jgi:hypothetical protein